MRLFTFVFSYLQMKCFLIKLRFLFMQNCILYNKHTYYLVLRYTGIESHISLHIFLNEPICR